VHTTTATIVEQAPDVHGQGRFEQQYGKKNEQEGLGGHLEIDQRVQKVRQDQRRPAVDMYDQAQQYPDDRQQHRIRQPQAARQRGHERHQGQQSGQAKYDVSYLHDIP
jgi:hypothetical protein